MPGIPGLRKFFGRTVSEGAAFAFGLAVGPALHPEVQELVNASWELHPSRPLDAGSAAAIVAEDVEKAPWGEDEAAKTGINADRFAALLGEALNAPGIGQLFAAWRRDLIDDKAFEHGLRKAKLEPRWTAPLKALKQDRLDPAVVAVAIQRGIIRDPGILPVGPPAEGGRVPAFPVFGVDAVKEVAANGIDLERLSVMVGNVGLPASAQQAASAYFRDLIDLPDYHRAIAEGNTRNEWRDVILEQARQIPSAVDGVQDHLRGWTDAEGMYDTTARHGMTREDTDLLFRIHGRPPSWHQIWIGLQRGGVYDGPTGDIDPAFLKGLRESDLRPEWYNLLWHSRYNYPAPFVLRALAQGGDLTEDETREILHFVGWEPTLAAKVSARWAKGGTAASKEATATDLLTLLDGEQATEPETITALRELGYSDDDARHKIAVLSARRVVSARNAAITTLHADHKKGEIDGNQAVTALAALGVPPLAAARIVEAWGIAKDAATVQPEP